MTSTETAGREPRTAVANFRVHFFGGTIVFLKAENAVKAEQAAIRRRPGMVRKVVYLGKANP